MAECVMSSGRDSIQQKQKVKANFFINEQVKENGYNEDSTTEIKKVHQ